MIVVEHDQETIEAADHIIDIGPAAGAQGGHVVAEGSLSDIIGCEESLTGKYLCGKAEIKLPEKRRKINLKYCIEVRGAQQNNLKEIDVIFPLGLFVCVTGVSGSGKSSLVSQVLLPALRRKLYNSREKPGKHQRLLGMGRIDKVIQIDQSPIGRTPRSNSATYTGVFDLIRLLFSKTRESKIRGFAPGRFSFNVKGGRCEACEGDGVNTIEMHFLPDVHVTCEVCKGRRYDRETLEVRYRGRSIADVLDMTVSEAVEFFTNIPSVRRKLQTLEDVGLGYIHLGQQATTLSGGEAQRVKLSTELSKMGTGQTLYILDEPTTGRHFEYIQMVLIVLNRLVERGNTVVVIEHNLDVIKTADRVVDLGPEGGDAGGYIIASGTPEEVAATEASYTGQYLAEELAASKALTTGGRRRPAVA